MGLLSQAPAAFGLVSFLMHAGLERNRIRKHLLVFALAAPVLAMLTFVGLSQVKRRKPKVSELTNLTNTDPSFFNINIIVFAWKKVSFEALFFLSSFRAAKRRCQTSTPPAWPCSSPPAPSSMWPLCTSSLRSGEGEQATATLQPEGVGTKD